MAGQPPGLKLEAFPLRVAVWETKHPGQGGKKDWTSYSCKLSRTYKDEKSGTWKETDSLGDRDLLAASALLLEVWRALVVKESHPAKVQAPEDPPPAPEETPF